MDKTKQLCPSRACFSLLGITVSFSRLERAIGMITPPFCIIFHAEAEFNVKTGPNLSKNTRKRPCGPIFFFAQIVTASRIPLRLLRAVSRETRDEMFSWLGHCLTLCICIAPNGRGSSILLLSFIRSSCAVCVSGPEKWSALVAMQHQAKGRPRQPLFLMLQSTKAH